MSKFGRRVRVGAVGMLAVIVSAYPVYAATAATAVTLQNAESPAIVVTEFQTNGGAAAQEFIELYNNTDEAITFGDGISAGSQSWKIQFFNSAAAKTGAPVWTTALSASNSINLTGTISAHGYFLIASSDYLPGGNLPGMTYAAASSHLMTDTGGALQLLNADPSTGNLTAHDRIMWLAQSTGTVMPQGVLAAPATSKSLQRIPNVDEEYLTVDGMLSEFGPEDAITPLAPWLAPVIVEPEPDTTTGPVSPDDGTTEPETTKPVLNEGLTPPSITELLPNPASPLTDADDEFIELYNPNTAAFDLEGYKLEVGTTTLHSYVFPSGAVLAPLGYQAFMSSETGLALSNSGGQVRFRDPAGKVLSETTPYTSADDNEAWVYADGVWQWTTSATPGVANILALPAVATKTSKSSADKPKTTKAATAKKATTKTAAKPKTTKVKAAKKTAKKKTETVKTAAAVAPEKPKPPIHVGILVAVVSVAVLYGLYEYRHDITLKLKQLGRNRKAGVTDRLATAGR